MGACPVACLSYWLNFLISSSLGLISWGQDPCLISFSTGRSTGNIFAKLNSFSFFGYSVIAPVSNRNTQSVVDVRRHTDLLNSWGVLLQNCFQLCQRSVIIPVLHRVWWTLGQNQLVFLPRLSRLSVQAHTNLLITYPTLDFGFGYLVDFIIWISGRLTRFKGEFLIPHLKSSILRSGIPPVSQTRSSWSCSWPFSPELHLKSILPATPSNCLESNCCVHLHSSSPGINHHLPPNGFSIHGWVFSQSNITNWVQICGFLFLPIVLYFLLVGT